MGFPQTKKNWKKQLVRLLFQFLSCCYYYFFLWEKKNLCCCFLEESYISVKSCCFLNTRLPKEEKKPFFGNNQTLLMCLFRCSMRILFSQLDAQNWQSLKKLFFLFFCQEQWAKLLFKRMRCYLCVLFFYVFVLYMFSKVEGKKEEVTSKKNKMLHILSNFPSAGKLSKNVQK